MKKKLIKIARNLLLFSLAGFLFWQVFKGIDFEKFVGDLKNANYWYVLMGLSIALVGHFSRAMRWQLLIRPLGRKISIGRSFIAVMINYVVNIAIPRAGEVSRTIVINKTDKVPVTKLLGTIIVERAFDLIVLLSIAAVAFLIEYNRVKDKVYEALNLDESVLGKYLNTRNILIAALLFVGVIVALILIRKSNRAFKKHPLYKKIREVLSGFWQGIKTIWKMETKWQFIFHTILIWVTYYFMAYVVLFAIEPTSHFGHREALLIFAISSLGFILPLPGGFGSYHGAVIIALGIYGILKEDALTYAVIAHTSQTLMLGVVGGFAYLAFLYVLRKQEREKLSTVTKEDI